MLVKYLKGRSKYIALPLVVVSIINIYLFAIDIFKNKYSELIYLDFLSANRPPTLSTAADCSIMLFNE